MNFGINITQRNYSWTEWKNVKSKKSFSIQYDEESQLYTIYGYDGSEVHLCTIWKGTVPDGIISNGYTQAQNNLDKVEFETDHKPYANKSLQLKNPGNLIPVVATAPREGSEVIYATHDFCNKTTWYSESIRVVNEIATDFSGGITWSLSHSNVINMTHGYILDEEAICLEQQELNPSDPHGYSIIVKVDDSEMVMREPYTLSGGDYKVDYKLGKIIFFTTQINKIVKVSYSYEHGSSWILQPSPNKNLDIEVSEAQFSEDVEMNDSIEFTVEGYVQIFAPQLWTGYNPPGPYPTNTRIPLATQIYKRFNQFIDEALGSYPVIPAIGGSPRGNLKSTYGFPFRYGTVRRLINSYGMRLICKLANGTSFNGERATATFYCTSNSE